MLGDNGEIIGGLGVIENDFHDRPDLRPNICAVYVEPVHRCKGMSAEAVAAVASMQPGRVVYVSCDPATLARDVLRFTEYGYELKNITAVDMFPRTCHVETIVLLQRETL